MATTQPAPVDLELKKALAELKLKMIDTNQKIKFSDVQIEGLKRSKRHKEITDAEVCNLAKEAKVYQGVGRCFFASSVPEVREGIAKSVADLNDKIQVFETNKEHLERDLKNSENAVRELVNQRKHS